MCRLSPAIPIRLTIPPAPYAIALPSPLTSKPLTGTISAVTSRWFDPSGFISQTLATPPRSDRKTIWFWALDGGSPVVNVHDSPLAAEPSVRLTLELIDTVYVVWDARGPSGVKTRTLLPESAGEAAG